MVVKRKKNVFQSTLVVYLAFYSGAILYRVHKTIVRPTYSTLIITPVQLRPVGKQKARIRRFSVSKSKNFTNHIRDISFGKSVFFVGATVCRTMNRALTTPDSPNSRVSPLQPPASRNKWNFMRYWSPLERRNCQKGSYVADFVMQC